MNQGWGRPAICRAWHYFIGPRALCGTRRHQGTQLYSVRPALRICAECAADRRSRRAAA